MIIGSESTANAQSRYPGGPCAVIEWTSKKFSTITRSSFCAELRNQLEAAQHSVLIAAFYEENMKPIQSASELVMLQDQGRLSLPIHLCGDNKGVFTAVCAQNPKANAEPTLTSHIKALRELLDCHAIGTLIWIDNRDMIADPLTKGKTRRNELNDVLNSAYWKVLHCAEHWPK